MLSLLQTTGHHLETCNSLGRHRAHDPINISGLLKSYGPCSLKYFCLYFAHFVFFKVHKTPNRHRRQNIYSALSKLAEKALPSQVYTQVKRHPILISLAASFLTVKYGLCLKFQGLEISSLLKGPKHLRQQLWIVCNAGAGFRVSAFMRCPQQCTLPHQTFRQCSDLKGRLSPVIWGLEIIRKSLVGHIKKSHKSCTLFFFVCLTL